jgi:hypothetical protein
VGFQELADVGFVNLFGHPEMTFRIEPFLLQEEAIGAVQVAAGSCRFGNYIECGRCVRQHFIPFYTLNKIKLLQIH